jgi:hypothetical protein
VKSQSNEGNALWAGDEATVVERSVAQATLADIAGLGLSKRSPGFLIGCPDFLIFQM